MSTETKATPTPWTTEGDGIIYAQNPDFDPTDLQTHEEILIADVAPESKLTEEDKANADLIVRAVNNHAELLAALHEIHALAETWRELGKSGLMTHLANIESKARAAIAKATP